MLVVDTDGDEEAEEDELSELALVDDDLALALTLELGGVAGKFSE